MSFRIKNFRHFSFKDLNIFKKTRGKSINYKPAGSVNNSKPTGPKNKFKRKYKFIFTFFGYILKQYKIILAVGICAFLVIFIRLLFSTDYFQVKELRFEGVEQIEKSELEQIAAKYKGKNIYTIDLDELEKDVGDLSVYIKGVYARKHLPSKIIVEITERYPTAVLVNFDGVYLIDKDNYVVSVPFSQSITFSESEWQAYYSQDVNLKIVQERVKANLDESEQKEFDYKEIDNGVKQQVLQEIKKEMNQVINAHFNSLNKQINESDYAGFQRIYFYANAEYEEGDVIDDTALIYTTKVLDFFTRKAEFTVSKTTWQSEFSLTVETLEKKTFVFGINRDINDQLKDLEVILKELKAEQRRYERIDLRAEIVSVR